MNMPALIGAVALTAGLAACGGASHAVLSGGTPTPTSPAATSGHTSAPTPRHSSSEPAPTGSTITATAVGTATASPAPTPTHSPSPSATPPSAGHTLTGSDAGSTIHVHVGDTISVDLGPSFHQPVSNDSAVVTRTSASGGYGTNQDARATFEAVAKGTADLSAYTDYPCLHATPPCEVAQQEWIVHVVVD